MIEVGRVCMKIAGRDAGRSCVITRVIDDNFVTIAGATRSKRCNIRHLEPTAKIVDINEGSEADVRAALDKAGIAMLSTKPRRKSQVRRKRLRKSEQRPTEKGAVNN